ncbi:gliding motility-associated C-terminal domain-containing protein [Pontibacter sp. 13R65]|uniref:T9SS type B sorting domain-containing protein n=1 Tax=Pontibacter sp. 13R65 TaxID=3127458 RepID=UPI00301C81D5
MKYLLFIFFLFSNLVVLAQSRCFKAYHEGKEVTVFCVGQTIRFKDCSGRVSPEQEYYYHPDENLNNPNKDTVKTLTFTKAGTVTIRQLANFNNQGTSLFTQTFEVKEAPDPTFTVNSCDKQTVQVAITDKAYDTYELDFGNGQTRSVKSGETATYTYPAEGPYELTLTGSYQGGTCSKSTTVQQASLQPLPVPVLAQVNIREQAQVNGIIDIVYLVESRYTYLLEHINPADNAVIAVDSLPNLGSGSSLVVKTLENINTAEPRCYRVRVIDPCGNSRVSNSICSIVFNAAAVEGEAQLSWKTHLFPNQKVEIRTGTNTTIHTSSNQLDSYTVANLACGQYCYSAYVSGADGVGIAQEQCIEISSDQTLPAGLLLSTYNQQNQVELLLQAPEGQEVRQINVQRSAGGNAQASGTSGTTSYLDELSAPAAYCYQATYTNDCKAVSSLSNTTCPMLLTVREQGEAVTTLRWSAYSEFRGGVGRYEVEVLDSDFQVLASYPVSGTSYTDNNAYDSPRLRYRIKATSRTGNQFSYSNYLEVVQPLKLFVPSAFSPNNDGLNDVFTVKGKFYENYSIKIYNRSGQVVYQSIEPTEGWDGTYQGQSQPAGAYVYEIQLTTLDGEKKDRKGTVTLIR